MKRPNLLRCSLAAAVCLLAFGCSPAGEQGSLTKVSSAIFDVPTSLTGPGAARGFEPRTVLNDAPVAASISTFYAMVRDQVDFGVEVARSLKALLLDLEEIKIGEAYLLDSETDITHTALNGTKYRWTTEEAGTYFLEAWNESGEKSLELRFTRDGTEYSGTAVASPSSLGWPEPTPPVELPDWVQVDFDTDADGLGTARLAISAQGFRYHEDLDPGLENGLIVLTKDSAGIVTLGSIVRGENSRHFVWNGYIRDTANQEVLNPDPSVLGETRYYVAAGIASTANHATVYLGIPISPVDETVFSGNGIGALVGGLFAARLNNNYDFTGPSDGDGASYDQGHEVIDLLNQVNGGNPALDYINTAEETLAALIAAQENLSTQYDIVDYLVGIMSVENPAYFDSTTYQSYGATVPEGWPGLSDGEAWALLPDLAQASVDAMDIGFEDATAPDF